MMIFGGSPIKVAVPPILEAKTSVIKNGTGSVSNSFAITKVIGIIRTTVVTLSKNADATAVNAAKARNTDILLCDTAGRLHNKKNLMEELKKISRIIEREYPDARREAFIVLDGTTGQNALSQAKQFSEVTDLTGIILTKLDGTAKGGIAIAIQSELNIPVKYIGVGEQIEDLQRFDSDAFVNALFDLRDSEEED